LDAELVRRVDTAYEQGQEHLGYALQWAQTYGYARDLVEQREDLARAIHFVHYEEFCGEPEHVFGEVLSHCDLDAARSAHGEQKISKSTARLKMTDDEKAAVWKATEDVATRFGLRADAF
jgi:hypothetical protein